MRFKDPPSKSWIGVQVRCSPETKEAAALWAAEEGVTLSRLAIGILEHAVGRRALRVKVPGFRQPRREEGGDHGS